jgi:pyridoxal phosphate enzyme (YggS family)
MSIKQNVRDLLTEIPPHVRLVAAAKTMDVSRVIEAIDAGVEIIGENYVQEAEAKYNLIGNRVKWHFIGHLQRNKVKKAVDIFDMIETVDSVEIALEIDKKCAAIGKVMPVLIEINSGCEQQKSGVAPGCAEDFIKKLSCLKNIKVMGMMTMGPVVTGEEIRPYFARTRGIFEYIKSLDLPGVEMKYLSMGMTDSYKIAIEEGANIVRIGSRIFGHRQV